MIESSTLIGSLIETVIFFYGISWVYKRFIKGKNSNEISKSINDFINSIKKEFEKNFNPKNKSNGITTQQIYKEEEKRRSNESYDDALRLYKAGVITKKELKEFKK